MMMGWRKQNHWLNHPSSIPNVGFMFVMYPTVIRYMKWPTMSRGMLERSPYWSIMQELFRVPTSWIWRMNRSLGLSKSIPLLTSGYDHNECNSLSLTWFHFLFSFLFLHTSLFMLQQTIKAFLSDMVSQDRGHLVSIASLAGLGGAPKLTDYCASKFAAVGLEESLRLELKTKGNWGVHSTVVCPFYIDTGMFKGVNTG